jgi:hypothetical protein
MKLLPHELTFSSGSSMPRRRRRTIFINSEKNHKKFYIHNFRIPMSIKNLFFLALSRAILFREAVYYFCTI